MIKRVDVISPIARASSEQELREAIDAAQPHVLSLPEPQSTILALQCREAAAERREVLRRGLENERRFTQGGGALLLVFFAVILSALGLLAWFFLQWVVS